MYGQMRKALAKLKLKFNLVRYIYFRLKRAVPCERSVLACSAGVFFGRANIFARESAKLKL